MEKVTLVLKRTEKLSFEPPAPGTDERFVLLNILNLCRAKHGDYVRVTFQPPDKKRSTGYRSQNHKLNGMIMQICRETGSNYDAVKNKIKMIAVETMGYPYEDFEGVITPKKERDCNTEECAMLIEAAYMLGADLGIIFKEYN